MGFEGFVGGLASDGGLYVLAGRVCRGDKLPFSDKVFNSLPLILLHPFMGDDVPRDRLAEMVNEAYAGFEHEGNPADRFGRWTLFSELYHGPTLAFKDVAMQRCWRV